MIHGIANGSNMIPDSPESAGFMEATKKIQQKTPTASDRNSPPAIKPANDFLILGFNMGPR